MRNLLVEKGYFTGAELERKMAEVRKRHDLSRDTLVGVALPQVVVPMLIPANGRQ
jgi:hypothetical protein